MCLLSVNKKGCHIQKFQNSFLSLEKVCLPWTSRSPFTCFSPCHWPPLNQNRGDFWTIARDFLYLASVAVWMSSPSGKFDRMVTLTLAWQAYRRPEWWHHKINGRAREQKHSCYFWHRPFFLSARYRQHVSLGGACFGDTIREYNF